MSDVSSSISNRGSVKSDVSSSICIRYILSLPNIPGGCLGVKGCKGMKSHSNKSEICQCEMSDVWESFYGKSINLLLTFPLVLLCIKSEKVHRF